MKKPILMLLCSLILLATNHAFGQVDPDDPENYPLWPTRIEGAIAPCWTKHCYFPYLFITMAYQNRPATFYLAPITENAKEFVRTIPFPTGRPGGRLKVCIDGKMIYDQTKPQQRRIEAKTIWNISDPECAK